MEEKEQEQQDEETIGKATVVGGTQARANVADEMQWTKYGTKTGHGFAAEDANALSEKLRGANVNKIGTSNEKDGADRISNGIQIQSKYCKTPESSLNDAFDKTTGKYRYYTDTNKTNPQVLEVPKDQYDKVLKGMEKCLNQNIKGKVSKKAISKLLSSNIISEVISGIVVVGPDLYRASISKSISWQQFAKNFSVFGAGLSGAVAGAELGAKISLATPDPAKPFVIAGTSIVTGTVASVGTKKILDQISEDDAQIMVEAMNERVAELAAAYCLTEEEFENLVIPKIKKIADQKWFVKMYQYGGRENAQKLYEFVDKEMLSIFEDAFKQKKHVLISKRMKVFFFTVRTKKIDGIAVPYVSNLKQMLLFISGLGGIAVLAVLLLLLLRNCSGCELKQKPVVQEIQSLPEPVIEKIVLEEQKSAYFLKDSKEFEDYKNSQEWLDLTAKAIKERLTRNPNLRFEVKGYVADFPNEIDDEKLSLERAENIISGLVERGVQRNILKPIPAGKTNRWSATDRRENRAATVYSVEE